jgi:hypothetical protein
MTALLHRGPASVGGFRNGGQSAASDTVFVGA